VTVRDARPSDLPAVAAIYAAAAQESYATFDLEAKPLGWWEEVLADPEYDLVVAAGGDAVLGYARTARHKE
jgi:L-amino acid N-acyltransferase YncA